MNKLRQGQGTLATVWSVIAERIRRPSAPPAAGGLPLPRPGCSADRPHTQPHLRASGHLHSAARLRPVPRLRLELPFHLESSWCLPCVHAHTSRKCREAISLPVRAGKELMPLAFTSLAADLGRHFICTAEGPSDQQILPSCVNYPCFPASPSLVFHFCFRSHFWGSVHIKSCLWFCFEKV